MKSHFNGLGSAIIFISSLFFISSGCSISKTDKVLKEGIIEYAISYIDEQPDFFESDPRPQKMIVRFKNNNSLNKIEALSGAVSFTFIQNIEEETTYTLVKLFNKKLFYPEKILPNQYPFAYSDMPNLQIEKTNETLKILGMDCYKAIATYNDSISESFDIWYTKDIGIDNPNINTPFEEIDGVMLQFSVTLFHQKMNITVSSIKSARIADDEFIIPSGYEKIEREVLDDVIALVQ